MAQRSARRGWKTSEWQSAIQARKADMDPVRELPYWPAAMALLIKAGQMTASDYVSIYPKLLLAFDGASTDAMFAVSNVDDRPAGIVNDLFCPFKPSSVCQT